MVTGWSQLFSMTLGTAVVLTLKMTPSAGRRGRYWQKAMFMLAVFTLQQVPSNLASGDNPGIHIFLFVILGCGMF